ncbi:MAG: hypothetical protein V4731_18695 [Pseudomonadota bacterium]
MLYALCWFAVFSLVSLWSLAAWGLHAMALWASHQTGSLAGGAGAVDSGGISAWLLSWLPPEVALTISDALLPDFREAIQAMIEWAPALSGGFSVAVWLAWGIGTALLVMLGFAVSGLIAAMHRRAPAHARA